ncbi:DUF2264 domain-containing protein [Pedobacter sp. PLR]|uniref:DUF2264 domain-containing protein n=1 Tax=Pedobacter sp. PLR TaxID=2994465 RepID=UPI0022479BDE|nr:DUF2264 domain-containing protein [Pedobacter sp. PLR]MCX2452250.1 DUF2264 domain-containing protein [Pedobacter sp. PLR]
MIKGIKTYGTLFLIVISFFSYSQIKSKKRTIINSNKTGLEDRAYWCNLAVKIAYPVIHNLAKGTLKKNMPLEVAPHYAKQVEKVTYMEAVGRTMAGLAPWLSLPDDETSEGNLRKKLRTELIKGLSNAVDPASPDYLNFRTDYQPIVDAAFIAHAFLRAPKALWEPLDELTKKRFVEEFKSLRNRKAYYNNWLLFSGITEAFLLSVNEQYDPARLDIAYNKIKEWYAGDGWYNDGPGFVMDYYNDFVIQPMTVDMLRVMSKNGLANAKEYEVAVQRMVRHSTFIERLISPEGTYPVFGRSITYRLAAFQSLGQISLLKKLPKEIKPAQVRCALTKVMVNMFDKVPGNFDANGWLQLGFVGHQPEVADTYTSTGSLYMCTLGFLPLGLSADDSFWSDGAEEWTSLKAWNGKMFDKDHKLEN